MTSAQQMASLPEGEARIAVIGERINPTGKKKLKAALQAGDVDYLVAEAAAQQRAGADILDVNVGVPGLDRADALIAGHAYAASHGAPAAATGFLGSGRYRGPRLAAMRAVPW